jgi:hypothetical protein
MLLVRTWTCSLEYLELVFVEVDLWAGCLEPVSGSDHAFFDRPNPYKKGTKLGSVLWMAKIRLQLRYGNTLRSKDFPNCGVEDPILWRSP